MGLVTGNIHVIYGSPTPSFKEAVAKVKVFKTKSNLNVTVTMYQWKGLVTRNAHVKCESSINSTS